MSFLDRLLGRRPERRDDWQRRASPRRPSGFAGGTPLSGQLTDEQAVERYRYLLRTAPPEAIEQAHAEGFAQLTPEQRRLVLDGLSRELPSQERTDRDDPQSLARMATRAELRRPGTLERTFGGMNAGGMGIGLGGLVAGSFLSSIAGVVIGTAIADAIFDDGGSDQGNDQDYADGSETAEGGQGTDAADAGYDSGDTGFDAAGDVGGGDFGGDFGGGDF
jgi:hypothetical protein